jgi:hypothetical protein
VHATAKLKAMLDYRRKLAEKRNRTGLTVTERILRFLQVTADSPDDLVLHT